MREITPRDNRGKRERITGIVVVVLAIAAAVAFVVGRLFGFLGSSGST